MLDRNFHVTKIIPASPKSFKSIIAEQRAAITEAFDTQAREVVEGETKFTRCQTQPK